MANEEASTVQAYPFNEPSPSIAVSIENKEIAPSAIAYGAFEPLSWFEKLWRPPYIYIFLTVAVIYMIWQLSLRKVH